MNTESRYNDPADRRIGRLWLALAFIVGGIAFLCIIWWLIEPSILRIIQDAGRLNACAGLSAGECTAAAEVL